jgi:hypothetical protein
VFVTAEGHDYARFHRALDRRNLIEAESAARELPVVRLEDALRLVHLYAERGSPKYEPAALRWLSRYASESNTTLVDFANVASTLAERSSRRTGR